MCEVKNCNPIRHLLRKCEHYKEVEKLQTEIVETRKTTNQELEDFNKRLNLIIKDDNIRVTLSNIKKVTKDA